tara:strand:- start:3377 stop:3724 length:348 start_codon:yes stop_codon:yes gene_type:complete
MKHLQTFEQHQINEGIFDTVKKWRTGFENDDERDDKATSISNQLDSIEALVESDPDAWVFNREHVEAKAEENNYRGEIRTQKGGRDSSRTYVVWDNKASGLEDIAGAAGSSTQKH